MKRVVFAPVLFLLLCLGASLQAAKVKGEIHYEPYAKIILKATDVSSDKAQFLWDIDGEADIEAVGGTLYVWAPPGRYKVTLTAVDFDTKKIERTKFTFTVGTPTPPIPPVPPGPNPPGPGPNPPPNPAPISDPGFRVLIVYETGETSKLAPAQRVILTSGTVRDYFRAKCASDSTANQDGKAYRIWDKDTDTTNELKSWQDAMKRDRKSIPWIVISNGKTGFEGPLPATVDDTLALLKKYEIAPTTMNKKGK